MSRTIFSYKATQTCLIAWLGHLTCLDLVLIKLGIYVDWMTSMGWDWCLHDGHQGLHDGD